MSKSVKKCNKKERKKCKTVPQLSKSEKKKCLNVLKSANKLYKVQKGQINDKFIVGYYSNTLRLFPPGYGGPPFNILIQYTQTIKN